MTEPRVEGASIIDDLYAGALEFSRWERAILRIGELVGSHCAGLFALDPTTGRVLRDEGYSMPEGAVEAYRDWATRDPRRELGMQVPVLRPIGESDLLPLNEWRGSAIFNELLKKFDCTYFLCTWLHKKARALVALSFQGTLARGPFTDEDRQQLQPYVGHMARALEIRDRLEEHAVRIDTLTASMGHASFGLMVLDDRGVVLEANTVAEQLLRDDAGISTDRDGCLHLRGRAEIELRHWLLYGRVSNGGPDAAIQVERPPRPALSVMLTSIPESLPLWLSAGPRWIAFVFDPIASGAVPAAAVLGRVLGVSDREAEAAALLAQGLDLRELAMNLGISVHTARDHLKSVYAKTGARSQAELVRRILRMPAGRPKD